MTQNFGKTETIGGALKIFENIKKFYEKVFNKLKFFNKIIINKY